MNRFVSKIWVALAACALSGVAAAQQSMGRGPAMGPVFQSPFGGAPGAFPYRPDAPQARPDSEPDQRRRDAADRRALRRGPNSLGADWHEQQEEARSAVRHGQFAPLGQVIDSLDRRTPGRQLDAGIEDLNGRPVYRVRWMTAHGRRIDYLVDAATGAVLGEH